MMITQTFIIALLVAVASAESKRVCRCTFDYQPLCASDGVVYSNKCLFKCAQLDNPTLSVLAEGQCPDDSFNIITDEKNDAKEDCFCTLEFRPLCGSNSVVYGNPCLFECARKSNPSLSVLHTGECDSVPSLPQIAVDPPVVEAPCICTREFKPVCARGSDGKETTYGNVCEFNCAKQKHDDLLLISSQSCTA